MKASALTLCFALAVVRGLYGGTSPVPIANPSFEANRNLGGGSFNQGDLQDLGLAAPTGWSVVAADNTAAANNGQEISFGWANLIPADPLSGPPTPQALGMMAGAVIGQTTDLAWANLIVGDILMVSVAAGDRNVNSPDGPPRWADDSFFGLSDGLPLKVGSPGTAGWMGNVVESFSVSIPPTGYKTGDMWDLNLVHFVTASDLVRTGKVGVFIASLGCVDDATAGTGSTGNMSFWDNVRLDLTTARPTIVSFAASRQAISLGSSVALTWEVSDADTVTIDNGIGAVSASGTLLVSPSVATTYKLTAVNGFGTVTRLATVAVVPQGPYRYYRFAATVLRDTASANSVQIAEFQMLLNGVRLAGATASNPGGSSPGGEGPQQANDNSLDSKWLDFTKFTPLMLDFGVTTDVDGYRLATANDGEDRDPVSWRVEGSHDSLTWVVTDEQTDYPTPIERQTYLPDFPLAPFSTGPKVTFTATPPTIIAGSSTVLNWSATGADYVRIDPGIGTVASTGTRSVSPGATTTYTLTATNTSGVTMRSLTVTVLPPGPYRYYRFVPLTLRGGGNTVQLCEFQMLMDGTRIGGATATNPGGSNPPNAGEGAEKANDNLPAVSGGSPDTKWLDDNQQPLVLDFGVTTDVNGYRWATGNDAEERDPVTWRVEGSHDNIFWTLIDQKTGYATPAARKTYLPNFPIAPFGNGPRVTFSANPGTIVTGTSSTLLWNVTDATFISVNNGIGPVAAVGSTAVSPAVTTTYTLTATNAAGSTVRSVQVKVVTGLPLVYNFDDGTFQGWTDLTAGPPADGWTAAIGQGWGGQQSGASAVRARFHDASHPTLLLRSPEFRLNGSGDLSAYVAGGDGIGSLAGAPVSALQPSSTDQGFMGIALRNKNSGLYVLSARKTIGDGDAFQPLTFSAAQLAALDQNATYTLDLVDACHGSWGWVAMDTVTIPGNPGGGNLPVISFSVSPGAIQIGQTATLDWSVTGASTVTIDNGVGAVAATGTRVVSPTATTTYTLTATGPGGSATSTAKVVVFTGALPGRTYDGVADEGFLNPIANLMAQPPTGVFEQIADIAYEDDFVANPELPGITAPNDFSILWQGWFDTRLDGAGFYTFGTESDDGSVMYLDLNEDGDFADPGELVVDNNGLHPKNTVTGSVDLPMNEVRIAIGFYQAGGGAAMYARFGRGENLDFASLQAISGATAHFKATNSSPLAPSITFAATPPGIPAGGPSTLSWSVINATSVSIDNGIGIVPATGSRIVTPSGATTYTLTATGPGGTRTKTATVTIVAPGPYRYYRFVPVQLRDPGENSVQLAEFQMLWQGARLGGATASNPGGNSPDNESPAQGNDNNLDTKWLDFTKVTPLVLDFGVPTPANGYRWATANDADGRDPVAWRIEGGHDGDNWVVLDSRTAYPTPTARKIYSAISLQPHPPFKVSAVLSPTTVTLSWASQAVATYAIEGSDDLGDPGAWVPVEQNILSAGATTSRAVARGAAELKFFRVKVQ